VLALILQLRFEHAPAGIQHGLRHAGLHELQAAHVANDDILILINQLSGKLMQRIGAAAGCFPMQALSLALVPAALRHAQARELQNQPAVVLIDGQPRETVGLAEDQPACMARAAQLQDFGA
jgi:predicted TIM-barrel enzyme